MGGEDREGERGGEDRVPGGPCSFCSPWRHGGEGGWGWRKETEEGREGEEVRRKEGGGEARVKAGDVLTGPAASRRCQHPCFARHLPVFADRRLARGDKLFVNHGPV